MHLRAIALVTLLLVVQGWCKPPKDLSELGDYNDDAQADEYDDYSPTDDDDESPDTIEEPPQIISAPVSKHVRAGTTVTLPCQTENADSFAVIWRKDDKVLYYESYTITDEPKRIVRTKNNSLVIYNTTTADSSNNYTCSITSRIPIMITHRLLVDPPTNEMSPSIMITTTTTMATSTSSMTTTTATPEIISTPSSPSVPFIQVLPSNKVEVKLGSAVTFTCVPYPRAQFSNTLMKWYRKNVKLHNDTHTVMVGNDLTISKVNRHDVGFYQCLADNGMSKPPMAAIHLTVNYAPEVEVEREVVSTGDGIESEITCIIHAHPHPNVTWYKNQKELPKKGRISQKDNKSRYTLRIARTIESDLGVYTCHAKNKFGEKSRTITLTGVPSQATVIAAEITSDNSSDLILKWRLESYSPISQYKLKYRRQGEEQWQEIEPRVRDGFGNQYAAEHVIVGLADGNYEVILESRNTFGWSIPSNTVTIKKEQSKKEEAASVRGSAVSIRPFWVITPVSLLVVCAFRNL